MVQQVTTLAAYGGPISLAIYGAPLMNAMFFQLSLPGPISPSFAPIFPSQQCQETDQGVTLVAQVLDSAGNPVNLRPATGLRILVVRPSGVKAVVPASLYTNGFDGQMSFVTGAGTPYGTGLDEAGTWQIQGRLTLSGNTVFTTVGAFAVLPNLGV